MTTNDIAMIAGIIWNIQQESCFLTLLNKIKRCLLLKSQIIHRKIFCTEKLLRTLTSMTFFSKSTNQQLKTISVTDVKYSNSPKQYTLLILFIYFNIGHPNDTALWFCWQEVYTVLQCIKYYIGVLCTSIYFNLSLEERLSIFSF